MDSLSSTSGIFDVLCSYEMKLLVVSAIIGALIGLEREIAGKDPSLRTFSLICVGSCLFAIISREAVAGQQFGDPSRIAAQVVTGIGFLGAGVIFHGRKGVSGLTTAALIWTTSAIGVAVGFGFVTTTIAAMFTVFTLVMVLKLVHILIRILRPEQYEGKTEFD
ncbi:MgtC/SapB family protein [bacterium]|nr:MgtC/SapB family protein [bacterium]